MTPSSPSPTWRVAFAALAESIAAPFADARPTTIAAGSLAWPRPTRPPRTVQSPSAPLRVPTWESAAPCVAPAPLPPLELERALPARRQPASAYAPPTAEATSAFFTPEEEEEGPHRARMVSPHAVLSGSGLWSSEVCSSSAFPSPASQSLSPSVLPSSLLSPPHYVDYATFFDAGESLESDAPLVFESVSSSPVSIPFLDEIISTVRSDIQYEQSSSSSSSSDMSPFALGLATVASPQQLLLPLPLPVFPTFSGSAHYAPAPFVDTTSAGLVAQPEIKIVTIPGTGKQFKLTIEPISEQSLSSAPVSPSSSSSSSSHSLASAGCSPARSPFVAQVSCSFSSAACSPHTHSLSTSSCTSPPASSTKPQTVPCTDRAVHSVVSGCGGERSGVSCDRKRKSESPDSDASSVGGKRPAPMSLAGLSDEQIAERKKEQNRAAAAKYREKMRTQKAGEKNECVYLEKRNSDLRCSIETMQREIAELRSKLMHCVA